MHKAPDVERRRHWGIGVDGAAEVIEYIRLCLEDLGRRLTTTLRRMSPADLAWRPNAESNSAGNLVIHICGNLRQRFHSGLGGAPDDRDREAEFSTAEPWTSAELVSLVERTFAEVDVTLAALPTTRLGGVLAIGRKPTTVLDILVRVVGHIGEHVGQIIYIAKARVGADLETLSIPRASR